MEQLPQKETKDGMKPYEIGVKETENPIARVKNEILNPNKMRTLSDESVLIQAVSYCFALIGLKKEFLPSDAQRAVLISFIKSKLAHYTPEEIKLAFELAIIGKYEVDLDHYGEGFSPKYLMRVFNAFLEYRNRLAIEVEREKLKTELLPDPIEEQRKIKEFFNESITIYKRSKDEFLGTKYHASVIYETLKAHFTREELIEFKKQAGEDLQRLKKQLEEAKRYKKTLSIELASTSFTEKEWRGRTALITANEAIKRKIII